MGGSCFADKMGLDKMLQSISILVYMMETPQVGAHTQCCAFPWFKRRVRDSCQGYTAAWTS
eukprot:7774165-Ditylum_brightwellii.AAC.1